MENLDPPSPPNQGWENGAFLPFARLHPWFGGDGGLLFHFILSKIVGIMHPTFISHGSRLFRVRISPTPLFPSPQPCRAVPDFHYLAMLSLRIDNNLYSDTTLSSLPKTTKIENQRSLNVTHFM